MSQSEAPLTAFVAECTAAADRLGLSLSTLSTKLFNDGKRIQQLANGGSDVGVLRLARAQGDLDKLLSAAKRGAV